MAGKVNTRFVVLLSAGLLAVCGLLVWAVTTFAMNSGEDHIRNGDKEMAAGDFVKAKLFYGKAVSEDRTRVDWLEKWLSALEAWTPSTETEYRDAYRTDYVPALTQIATVQRTNIEAHDRLLSLMTEQMNYGYSRGQADLIANSTTGAAAYFDRDPSADPAWRKLLRYRGLAREVILGADGVMLPEEIELIEQDLRAALEVDPSDSESAAALVRWTVLSQSRDLPSDAIERLQAARREAMEVGQAFLEQNPNDPLMMVTLALMELDIARTDAGKNLSDQARSLAMIEAMRGIEPRVAEVEAAIRAAGPEGTSLATIRRFQALDRSTNPTARLARSRQLVADFIELDPSNTDLVMISGALDKTAGELESASERYASLVDLEMLPLSLEGLLRFDRMRQAMTNQALIDLDRWGSLDESVRAAEGAELLAGVRALRERYSDQVSEDDATLSLLDGRLAESEGKRNEALRLYKKYNSQVSDRDPDGLWFEARIAQQLGQLGTSRDALGRLVENDRDNLRALLSLADLQWRLQQPRQAEQLYNRALIMSPGNEIALAGLKMLRSMEDPTLIEDPVISLLVQSRNLRNGSEERPADPAGAARLLEQNLEVLDYEPRLVGELMSMRVDQGDVEGARVIGREAVIRNPDDEQMARLVEAMSTEDPIELLVSVINASERTEQEKLIGIAGVYLREGMVEELGGVVDQLMEIAPDDSQTIDLGFVQAIRMENFEKANEIAVLATTRNVDNVNGLSYQARLASAEGRADEAVSLLQQAAALGTGDASIYRLLGMQLRELGRVDAAQDAFEQALRIRPSDSQTTTDLVQTLASAGRYEQALDIARRQQRFGLTNPLFVELWLQLEAVAGGPEGRALAIAQREQLIAANPTDEANRYSLTQLYIQTENWDSAKTLIDAAMAEERTLRTVELLARWYADQGRVGSQDGLLLANQAYQRYIESLGDDVSSQPFLSLARFMISRGRQDLAVGAAEQAVAFEDAATMEGTKLKGDLLMALGRPVFAAEEYKAVIAGGADDESGSYQQRLVEMYLRANEYELASVEIENMPASATGTLSNLLQRSEITAGLGDTVGERRVLDDAASKFPNEPLVYIRRAQSMLGQPALLPDLLADIEAALRLSPNDWRAYRVRSAAYFGVDRKNEALRDLRAVLRANPSLDDALFSLMNELLNDDRVSEAMDAAREVLDARPTDTPLMYQLGKLFESREDWDRSAEMFERAWETRRSPSDGASFIDAALRQSPPNVAAANAVITDLAGMVDGGLENSPGLLAAQSLVLRARGREEFAVQQMTKAFDLCVGDERQLQSWGQNASRFYLDFDASSEINYYRSLRARFPDAETRAWIDTFMAQRQLARDVDRDVAIASLARLSEDDSLPETVRVLAFRSLGNEYFQKDAFEQAVEAWSGALEVVPDNWEMNNNIAYALSAELGRHEEGLAFAERAVEKDPSRSEPYDTLAGVYLKLGRFDEAEQMISLGEQRARSYTARVTMTITRAKLAAAQGDTEEADRLLNSARALLRTVAGRNPELEEQIQKAQSGIDSDG